jgi:hypothetical protein
MIPKDDYGMQVSKFFRRAEGRFHHWCPACQEMHQLPDSWTFNGNLESPTFTPSFKHTGHGEQGVERTCHYVLTDGILNFCGDCTHALAGQAVPLLELPVELRD